MQSDHHSPPRALILDFDGLIVDSEGVGYRLWRETFSQHGVELTIPMWMEAVGHAHEFDPRPFLEQALGPDFDWTTFVRSTWALQGPMMQEMPALPGVRELVENARRQGLKLGVASNADRPWVIEGLTRLGLIEQFQAISTIDDVANPKPAPDVYLQVLENLEIDPAEAVAFEDSRPGVLAARAAGLYVVAVPNQITRHMDLSEADRICQSLAEFTLGEVTSGSRR